MKPSQVPRVQISSRVAIAPSTASTTPAALTLIPFSMFRRSKKNKFGLADADVPTKGVLGLQLCHVDDQAIAE
jgi:hypothetical protein